MKRIIYILILTLIFTARPAYAYLDPGTGSYLFQIILAGLLAGSYFFRDKLKKVFNFFSKMLKQLKPKEHAKK